MTDHFSAFPVVSEIAVRWGDMDAFQHVNNTLYIRYFEIARIDYFAALSLEGLMQPQGVGPILGEISCRFRFPATYPDTVAVGTRVTHVGNDRFIMEHKAVSRRHDRVAASGTGVIVAYDYSGARKATVSTALRAQIEALEATAGNRVETYVWPIQAA